MLDKSLFKSIACGCLPLFASADMADIIGTEFAYADGDAGDLAQHLAKALSLSEGERAALVAEYQAKAVAAHTLPVLADKLAEAMTI